MLHQIMIGVDKNVYGNDELQRAERKPERNIL